MCTLKNTKQRNKRDRSILEDLVNKRLRCLFKKYRREFMNNTNQVNFGPVSLLTHWYEGRGTTTFEQSTCH